MNVITMGAHILDVLVRSVTDIPPGQETALVEQMRMTAAGTAAGTALTFAKLGASVRTAGAIGTDPAGDILLTLLGRVGIDTGLVVRKDDVPTSISVVRSCSAPISLCEFSSTPRTTVPPRPST
jgi:sugar/nucleoside kinase (ribokinase family)